MKSQSANPPPIRHQSATSAMATVRNGGNLNPPIRHCLIGGLNGGGLDTTEPLAGIPLNPPAIRRATELHR